MKDYTVNKATHEYYYESNYAFSQNDGFQVAAAVTSYDGNQQSIEDPEIGQIKFYLKQWGLGSDGLDFIEVKTKPCQPEDFNWGTDLNS